MQIVDLLRQQQAYDAQIKESRKEAATPTPEKEVKRRGRPPGKATATK